MNFEFDNNLPIYIQLVEQLKIYIISGKIEPGSRILSVRDFALAYKVNPNTVQKALIELEELGLIYTERTNGKFVTNDIKKIRLHKEKYAKLLTENYINSMKNIGFDNKKIIEYLGGRTE